jgi:hypothetical protein
MERLFKLIYFAGVLAQIILRMPYERQGRQNPEAHTDLPKEETPDWLRPYLVGGTKEWKG